MLKKPVNVLAVALFVCLLTTTAFADDEGTVRNSVFSLYKTVRMITLPLAAVGIAGSGIQIAAGDVQSAAKAKRRILVICMAVAAVWLIPGLLSSGRNLLSSGAWDPQNPG